MSIECGDDHTIAEYSSYSFFIYSSNVNHPYFCNFVKFERQIFYNIGTQIIISPGKRIHKISTETDKFLIKTLEGGIYEFYQTPMLERLIKEMVLLTKPQPLWIPDLIYNSISFKFPTLPQPVIAFIDLNSFINECITKINREAINEIGLDDIPIVLIEKKKELGSYGKWKIPIERYSHQTSKKQESAPLSKVVNNTAKSLERVGTMDYLK